MEQLKKYFESQPWNQPQIVQVGLNLNSYLRALEYIQSTSEGSRDIAYLSNKELSEQCGFTQDEIDIIRAYTRAETVFDPNYYAHSGFQGCFEQQLEKIKASRQKG